MSDLRDEIRPITLSSDVQPIRSVPMKRSPTIAEVLIKKNKDATHARRKVAQKKKQDDAKCVVSSSSQEEMEVGGVKLANLSDQDKRRLAALEEELAQLKKAEEAKKAEKDEKARLTKATASRVQQKEVKDVKKEDRKKIVAVKKNIRVTDNEEKDMKSKKRVKVEVGSNKFESIRIRTTLKPMWEAGISLSIEQKEWLRESGFGSFIDLPISVLPGQLGYFVVDNFYPDTMEIKVRDNVIKVTADSVADVFGIPNGGMNIMELPDVNHGHPCMIQFKKEFPSFPNSYLSAKEVVSKIVTNKAADFCFKLKFFMLFANTMGRCFSNGNFMQHFVYKFTEDTDFKNLNWCQFIMDCLERPTLSWKNDKNTHYQGPITFLTLLYLDNVKPKTCSVIRERPIICNWTNTLMKMVQEEEVSNGGFGLLDFVGEYIQDDVCEDEEEVKEAGATDCVDKLLEMIMSVKKTQLLIEENLHDAMKKFPGDHRFEEVGAMLDQIFRSRVRKESEVVDENKEKKEKGNGEEDGKEDGGGGKKDSEGNLNDGGKDIARDKGEDSEVNECLIDYFMMEDEIVEEFDEDVPTVAGAVISRDDDDKCKPTVVKFSPYINKKTDVTTQITVHEYRLSNWLFAMMGDKFELVFENEFGMKVSREDFETLAPGCWISGNMVDVWASILNQEENFHLQSTKRLFFPTSIFPEHMFRLTKERKIEAFKSSISAWLRDDDQLLLLKHVDMVFFPIFRSSHFYLLVFHLTKRTFHVIDNSCGFDYDLKYKETCNLAKSLFVQHLKDVGHPACDKIRKLERATVMQLKWKTRENHVDCGVFVMMHMDQFLGQPSSKFECGLDVEGRVQKMQLIRLRIKYATKMLLNQLNCLCNRVQSSVDLFLNERTREVIENEIKNAIGTRQKLEMGRQNEKEMIVEEK